MPTLTACTATNPTNIEADRYTANWTSPADEVIDYYMVTRTRYVGSNSYEEKLPAEDNYLEITGFDESDTEAYYVESVRLETYSPKSNVVFVNHSGISGVDVDEPLIVRGFNGFLRIDVAAPQTNCRIYDMSGRQLRLIESVDFNLDIDMPAGIYLITTDQHSTRPRQSSADTRGSSLPPWTKVLIFQDITYSGAHCQALGKVVHRQSLGPAEPAIIGGAC